MVLKKCWLSLDNSLQLYNFFDYLISRDTIKYPNIVACEIFNQSFVWYYTDDGIFGIE